MTRTTILSIGPSRPMLRLLAILFPILLASCKSEIYEPTHTSVVFSSPPHFPATVYNVAGNEVTDAGFELGRRLFYDGRLSRDGMISCGTCHMQSSAFTHHGHDLSHGIEDRLGRRNSQPIMNLAWSTSFLWDGGVFDLDLQPVAPITNVVEMDYAVDSILERLRNTKEYPVLFQKAFGTHEITTSRFMKALSQFMIMCISNRSKYDSVIQGINGATFSPEELAGYNLFKNNCSGCHAEPLFTDNSFRNNGLKPGPNNDLGRYEITLHDNDRYRFKVPSLRNISYTAPYMHDGRMYSLNAVLEHYRKGIVESPTLDPVLRNGSSVGIQLSDQERDQVIAFLKTLDDKSFITDRRLSEY